MITTRLRITAIAALVLCACAAHRRDTNATRQSNSADALSAVMKIARQHDFEPPEESLVSVESIQLSSSSRGGYRGVVLGTIPPHEVILAATDSGLVATSIDMEPVVDGLSAFVASLRGGGSGRTAHEMATDLIRLGLGSQPGGAHPLGSVSDIPIDIENSDVYRDLRAQGVPKAEIQDRLLHAARSLAITEPQFADSNVRQLTFWTWSYYGGVVRRWSVRLAERGDALVEIHSLASSVGSFDLRM